MACSNGTLRRCQGPESCVLGIERRRRPTPARTGEPGGLALQAALAGNGALVGEAGGRHAGQISPISAWVLPTGTIGLDGGAILTPPSPHAARCFRPTTAMAPRLSLKTAVTGKEPPQDTPKSETEQAD